MKKALIATLLFAVVYASNYFSPERSMGLQHVAAQTILYGFFCGVGLTICKVFKRLKRNQFTILFGIFFIFAVWPWFLYVPRNLAFIIDGDSAKVVSSPTYHGPRAQIFPFDKMVVLDNSTRIGGVFTPDSASIPMIVSKFDNQEGFKPFVDQQFHEAAVSFISSNALFQNRAVLRAILTPDSINTRLRYGKLESFSFY